MKQIVHSVKHYVQFPIDQIGTGTIQNITLVKAVESTVANAATEVEEGSIIKAVYVQLLLQNQSNLGEFICALEKAPNNSAGMTFAQSASLFTYNNKKNIFYVSQGLTSNDGVGNPQVTIRQWFKIPKGKQRFGLGDALVLSIANVSANNLDRCGFATYKEYS